MDYQDFTIDVRSAKEEGLFEARATGADWEERVSFPMPLERKEAEDLLAILSVRASPANRAETQAPDLRSVGERLYRSLFRNGLASRLGKSREDGSGVRIRLRFDFRDPEAEYLSALPWELLRDGDFLSADPHTPVVRDVLRTKPLPPLLVEAPLRILLAGAAEPGTSTEKLVVEERDRMERILQPLIREGQVVLAEPRFLSLDNLRDALKSKAEPVHVLHFIGHGGYHSKSGFGVVDFVGPHGRKHEVKAETFADHLKDIPWLRLVVLSSCNTARDKGAAAFYRGVAAAILERTQVQAVVAQQHKISFTAASRFSEVFYRRIAEGDDMDVAITDVRLRLRSESDEWTTPVLFLSSQDGKLFDVKPAEGPYTVTLPRPSGEPVRLGVRSIDGWGKDMEQRCKVLSLVKHFDGRFIKDNDRALWHKKVFPDLQTFLCNNAKEGRPLLLDFAAHSSIAFAAGWVLEAKSGLDVRVRQRTQNEAVVLDWHPRDHQECPVPEGPLWIDEPDVELSSDQPDVAVALSVSQPRVEEHVESYIRRKGLPVSRILRATIAPEAGQRSVKGGAHSLLLAQALVSRIRQRRPHERNGTCHLFCAAPNALVFYLGQLSRSFGRIVLYEHPFGTADNFGKYQPSIELAAPGPSDGDW